MARVKKGLEKKKSHQKILSRTKGYRGAKSRLIKSAKEAYLHAGEYAFGGRKQRKRQKRRLWITKINAFLKSEGLSYNKFIKSLGEAKIQIDRKVLSELSVSDPNTFKQIISKLK